MLIATWIITFALLLFHQGSAQLLEPDCGVVSDPINGVRPNPTPWLALIRGDRQKCSGALIHQRKCIPNVIDLCVENPNLLFQNILVRLGDYNEFPQNENVNRFPYEEYYVETAIVNYLFNETIFHDDIALLKLRGKVTYKPHIRPICVVANSTLKAEVDTFKEFAATLWGLNEMRPFQNPKTNTINRLNDTQCTETLNAPESSQICASFTNGGNCLELGSPLGKMLKHKNTHRYALFGIQSYGTSKTCMYTDIMSYVDWIVQNVLDIHIVNLEIPKTMAISN
ncbi:hypothetical protein KR054_003420 [Drosophila jambulina]|nr:hypothetical protein KR054_003420 [Drosophila jambulina]